MKNGKGKFYGIGVGVGDPENITVKAVKKLRDVDVIVLPEAKGGEGSTAFEIVKEYLREDVEQLFLEFPMIKDVEARKVFRKNNAETIIKELEKGKAGFSLTTDGVMPEWVDRRNIFSYAYDNRGQLRLFNPIENAIDSAIAIVEKLGLFTFSLTSDEPDDDESCFDTGTGKWLLEIPNWDLIISILYPEISQIGEGVPKILQGAAFCAVSSISTLSYASFSCILEGADIGDSVVVTSTLS